MLLAVGVSSFMSALDGSIVNTILPVIARSLNSDLEHLEWVVTIFLLVLSGLMLGFGRLGDMLGCKRVYLWGFGIFVAASGLCGVAPSVAALVASRGLQALGSAMILANAPAILTRNFPAEQRGRALGLQASLTYAGLTVGPTLGGWLAQALSWRAVFFINLPVGAGAFLLSSLLIPRDQPAVQRERFDAPGALAYIAGLTALLLTLNKAHEWGWGSLRALALTLCAGVFLVLFVRRERRTAEPMLDLTLFRSRVFSMSTLNAVLNYICQYTVVFMLPFYLIQARGLSPAQAGLILSAQPLIMAFAAPTAGILSDRMDGRILSSFGMLVFAVGLVLLARLDAASPMWQPVVALLFTGMGTGTFIAPNNSALMGAAPRGRQGIAAGILSTARNTGMMLGVGLAGAIFTTVLAHAQSAGAAEAAALTAARFTAISASFIFAAVVAVVCAVTSGLAGRAR